MSKQNPPKRHHYVPRTYLKAFFKNGSIKQLNLESGAIVSKQSAKSIAFEEHFYDLETEYELGVVENHWHNIIERIQNNPERSSLNEIEQNRLVQFIALLLVRGPRSRNFAFDAVTRGLENVETTLKSSEMRKISSRGRLAVEYSRLAEQLASQEIPFNRSTMRQHAQVERDRIAQYIRRVRNGVYTNIELERIKELGSNQDVLRSLFSSTIFDYANHITRVLKSMTWQFSVSPGNVSLLTSDNPVCVLIDHKVSNDLDSSENAPCFDVFSNRGRPNWFMREYRNQPVHIHIPLSPRLLWIASNVPATATLRPMSDIDVVDLNYRLVLQSSKFVYGDDLSLLPRQVFVRDWQALITQERKCEESYLAPLEPSSSISNSANPTKGGLSP